MRILNQVSAYPKWNPNGCVSINASRNVTKRTSWHKPILPESRIVDMSEATPKPIESAVPVLQQGNTIVT